MNRNRLVFIGLAALLLAALASLSIYRLLHSRLAMAGSPALEPVVVAAADLSAGTRLRPVDLQLTKMPAAHLPAGVFHHVNDLKGRGLVLPVSRGSMILNEQLAAPGIGGGLPAMIPPGMRAVSVKVNDVVAVAGFAVPGTHVDVLLTGNPTSDASPARAVTTTVLENVEVLAAGQQLQRTAEGKPQLVPVITLLVSPADAQKLTLASNEGRIQLALRNPLDAKQQITPPLMNASLYRGMAPPRPARKYRRRYTHLRPRPAPVPAREAAPYKVEILEGSNRVVTSFARSSPSSQEGPR